MATRKEMQHYLKVLAARLETEDNMDWNDLVVPLGKQNPEAQVMARLINRQNRLLQEILMSLERMRMVDDAPTPNP